ncbi:hypothetical protein BVRB_041720, partial [Beta vulgaris subsp. vulgaris]
MPAFNPSAAEFVPRFDAAAFVPDAQTYTDTQEANWDDEDAQDQLNVSMAAVSVQSPPASQQQQKQPEPEPEPEPIVEEEEDEDDQEEEIDPSKYHDPRENLNVVFIGHVDAGKSTISG